MFSGRLWNIFIDSFPKMLLRALTGTIPLTVIAFALAMVIAVVVALVQFANVKVLKSFCRFYIWIFRGTPLLVQLYIVFFGLSKIGILLDPFPAAVIVFSLKKVLIVQRRFVHRSNRFQQDSWRQVSVQVFRTCKRFSELCCHRRCVPRSHPFSIR